MNSLAFEITHADWVQRVQVKDRLAVDVLLDELDLGEAETIVLAKEINADWILMDEKKGRRKLTQLGLAKIGTIGLLRNRLIERVFSSPKLEQISQKIRMI